MEIELSLLGAVEVPVSGSVRLDETRVVGRGKTLADQGVRFPEPFEVEGAARRVDGEIVVNGRVKGRARLECSRCLSPVEHVVDAEFTARFLPAEGAESPSDRGKDEEETELEEEDLDASVLPAGATALSVEDVVLEQVLLDLPFRALCREDCRGLCPRCGQDRNEGDCGCEDDEAVDPRLAPLLELRRKLKDE